MSNKPKIRAFCEAGCAWETVHMDDFLKSATFYEVGQPDGYAVVDAYRKYRIFSDSNTNTGKYIATIEFQSPDATGETYVTQNTFTVSTGYRKYFDFEVLQALYNGSMLRIVYEVNGSTDVLNLNLATTEHDLTKSRLKITGASQVLIYNDTAEILGNASVLDDGEVDGGGNNVNTPRHAVVVTVIDGVASRSAQEIFDLLQYGCVVVALVNGNYCYQYKRVILADSGVIDRCEFSFTDVNETQDTVTTFCISIDKNKFATSYQYKLSPNGSGGGSENGYDGSFVIDWKDSRLGMGNTNGDYFTNGAQIDVYPANERTYRLASEIGLYVYMVADHTSNDVIIFELNDSAEIPDETMTFNFNVTDTGTDDPPAATLFLEWPVSGGDTSDCAKYAENARKSSEEATAAKTAAETAAARAEAAETSAEQSAENASQSWGSAENAKTAAEQAASNAASSASAASTSATNAGKSATAAATSAQAASTAATNATTAKSGAESAKTAAETAKNEAQSIKTEVERKLANGEYKGDDGKSAYAYAKDGGYGGTEEEFAAKLAKDNPTMANYAFAPVPQLPANGQKEGDVIGGSGGDLEPDFENAIDPANCLLNQRISSSGSIKADNAAGDVTTDYIPATSSDEIFVNLPLANFNEDYSRVKFYSGNASSGYSFISSADARLGTQFTVTEENGYCRFKLNTYNGSALGATYTAIRLVLHINTTTITEADIADLIVTVNQPITYTEIPAEGETAKVSADFDGNNIKAQDIYDYMDKLVAKYPRLITKEVMGKDASGKYDWCRYVFGSRAYDAWVRPDKPAMYAWVNGSTTIYSVSVSPRIGDTLYSTAYIGTVKGTVTAVSNANQTRTVGGVVYTRDKTKDIEPTLVYTETAYSPNYIGTYQGLKNEVTRDNNGVKNKVGTITAMSGNSMTCTDGYTYTRYPLGDRDESYRMKPTILLGANEHGLESDGSGDTPDPAIITARLAKDLCECDPRHAYLNMLREGYKIVLVPIINPYGFTVGKYTNSNNVNIDRNFDTTGWGNDTIDTRQGVYGGSENETQYWMNTCVASKAVVGMANHSYGRKIDSNTGEIVVAGTCGCMIPRPVDAYNKYIEHIEMVMTAYNLSLIFSNSAEPETYAKTRSYMDLVGIKCCALEMQVSEGFLLNGGGQMFTERVMEANYTLLLQFLNMLIDNQD